MFWSVDDERRLFVMAGLIPAIQSFRDLQSKVVAGRDKPCHDGWCGPRN